MLAHIVLEALKLLDAETAFLEFDPKLRPGRPDLAVGPAGRSLEMCGRLLEVDEGGVHDDDDPTVRLVDVDIDVSTRQGVSASTGRVAEADILPDPAEHVLCLPRVPIGCGGSALLTAWAHEEIVVAREAPGLRRGLPVRAVLSSPSDRSVGSAPGPPLP